MKDRDRQQEFHKELEIARRQIAKCKASEARKNRQIAALIDNEERFNLFIENFPDPIISYSMDGSIQYVNKKTEEITGYSRDELVGKNIIDSLLVSKRSIPIIEMSLDKQNRAKQIAPYEIEGLSKSGATIFFEVVGVPINVKGKSEVFVIARDITRKKLADQKAEHLESVLQSIRSANISFNAKKSREMIMGKACDQLVQVRKYQNAWIVLFDENSNFITGARAGIGHEFKSIINKFQTGKPLKCVKSSLKHDEVIVTDNPLIDCCECPLSMIYYNIGCVSVRFKYDNSFGVIVASLPSNLVRDKEEHNFLHEVAEHISSALHSIELEEENRLVEGALRESEEKHRQILEFLNEGIWQIDSEGMTTFVNPSMARMLGYKENDFAGKHLFDFLSETDKQKASNLLQRHIKGRQEQYTVKFIRKDGAVLYASMGISPITSEDGEYTGSIISVQDVTGHMRAEEALKESEHRYRLLADNASDVIMLMDMNLQPVYFSPSVTQMLGYSVEEALEGSMEGRMPPSSIDKAVRQFQAGLAREKRYAGGASGQKLELEMIHKDGSLITIEMMASFIRDISGKPTGIMGILRDITDRKRVEEKLRISEEKYRALFEHSNEAICIAQDSVLKLSNPKTSEMTGYSINELYLKPFIDIVHPDDRDQVFARHIDRIKGRKVPNDNYFRFVKKSGEVRWAQINTVAIDWEGKPATLNFVSDVTERKQMEETLCESEDRHRALVEASSKAGIGIVILQSAGDQEAVIVFANDGSLQITGYSREEILSKPLGDFIPPEEFLIVLERYRTRQRGMPAVPYYETYVTSKNGAKLPILISAATLKYQGKIATVVYFRDVTQIREAERKAALHAKNMEAILAVARAVSQIPATNKMITHALDIVNEAVSCDKSCIYLLDREKKCLRMKACRGVSDSNIRHYADLPLSETQLKNLQHWRDPLIPLEDIFGKAAAHKMKLALEKHKAHSYTAVPLMIKDIVSGILFIVSDKNRVFTADDIELLTALSFELAIGIDNAELLDRTIAMSLTDELTGLNNRRHFYNSLEMEMYRTKRYGQPFALVLFDLNGFKEYNDKYGHASGDSVLRIFAKSLRESFRKTDIICRYGGDEFSIILPAADDKTAKDIVERFRVKWSKICEETALVDKSPLGFSCGIARFPDNSESADGLVFLADAAMYCAKTGMGNISVMASEISSISSDVLRAASRDHIYALAATVDAKDPSTYGHSKRVADIAEKIGKAIGLPPKELSKIYSAALLHDIGKIGVPDSILTKPGRPTPDEWTILRSHSSEGAKIVGYVRELDDLVPIILHHHEWYNGKGYPDGLHGADIPIGARITSVADAYDTMTTERPYRNLISSEKACEELARCSGTQFDPTVVKIWCKTIQQSD